jgi:signal transduction histidine kinase
VSWALACCGWAVALGLALLLRCRRSLLRDVEHELRGGLTTIGLAMERMRHGGLTRPLASVVSLQLDRMEVALVDLERACAVPRRPRRTIDIQRVSQVTANLVANAAEHGSGPVDVRWSEAGDRARLEVSNRNAPEPRPADPGRGRGRGLAIARRAARDLGGSLVVESCDDATVATFELPAAQRGGSRAA